MMRYYSSMQQVGTLADGFTPLYHAPQFAHLGTTLAVRAQNGYLLPYFRNLAEINVRSVQAGTQLAIAPAALPPRTRDRSFTILHTVDSAQPQGGPSPGAIPFLPILVFGLILLILAVAAWITVQAIRSWRSPPCQQRSFDVSERTAGAMNPSCEVIYFDKETGEEVGRSAPPTGPVQQLGGTIVLVAFGIGVAVLIAKAGPGLLARRPTLKGGRRR